MNFQNDMRKQAHSCFEEYTIVREIQHFSVTIHRRKRSRVFYAKTLRFPLLGETVNRGERAEKMHCIRELVNVVSWYQIGDSGMETFYLPRHPSQPSNISDMREPGYRYLAFWLKGFDDFARRLAAAELDLIYASSRHGKCFRVKDPDGINLLFFDSGESARAGHVSGLKEAGMVVSDDSGFDAFFNVIGLNKTEEGGFFLEELFGISEPAPLYGNIRLITPAETNTKIEQRNFPGPGVHRASPRRSLRDVGIQHIAFYVDDINDFYKKGVRNGISFLFSPTLLPGGNKMTYFLDPEGNIIEVMQVNRVTRTAARIAGKVLRIRADAAAFIEMAFP